MITRFLALLALIWAFGFLWFAIALPQPGGAGRIPRGLEVIDRGLAQNLLVTGVDPEVKPAEFAAEFEVPRRQMRCCVTLGYAAVDTRGNAAETANWVRERKVKSLRLVTTDWHMRRAVVELERALPGNVTVLRDAVPSQPNLSTLFLEYHKLLATSLRGIPEI